MKLTIKQTKALDYLEDTSTSELLFGGGAGGGKSALGCYWQIKNRLKYPGTRGLIGRSKLKVLKETTLNTFFEIARLQGLRSDVHYSYKAHYSKIEFINGSEILLKDLFSYPSDPEFDDLGSLEITDAFIDEANQISKKAKNIVKSRIRYKLDENNITPKILMTCNPAKNWVYSDFYKPDRDRNLPSEKKFIQALLSDNIHISKHYKKNLLTLDINSKERLLYGNWEYDDDPSRLIEFDSMVDLFTNTHINETNEKYISCDVARLGSDKAVIMVWSGWVVKEIFTFDKSRLNEIQDKLTSLKNTYNVPNSHIIADEDGVGGGLVDYMRIKGFVNNSKALKNENYANLKSQCYYKLANKINEKGIYIENDQYREEIIKELEQIKSYKIDSDTKMRVLPKDKVKELIGHSPDFTDTLMMRMYFTLQSSGQYAIV